jgi:hypothetical protein
MKNTQFRIALFVVGLIVLLAFQSKLVMPVVYKIIASDIFLEKTDDKGSQMPVSTEMTRFAFNQCNAYLTKNIDKKFSIVFPKEPLNSWDVGNYEYVINAEVNITSKEASTLMRRYACNIRYKNKSDITEASNADNWTIDGLSGMDDL